MELYISYHLTDNFFHTNKIRICVISIIQEILEKKKKNGMNTTDENTTNNKGRKILQLLIKIRIVREIRIISLSKTNVALQIILIKMINYYYFLMIWPLMTSYLL